MPGHLLKLEEQRRSDIQLESKRLVIHKNTQNRQLTDRTVGTWAHCRQEFNQEPLEIGLSQNENTGPEDPWNSAKI